MVRVYSFFFRLLFIFLLHRWCVLFFFRFSSQFCLKNKKIVFCLRLRFFFWFVNCVRLIYLRRNYEWILEPQNIAIVSYLNAKAIWHGMTMLAYHNVCIFQMIFFSFFFQIFDDDDWNIFQFASVTVLGVTISNSVSVCFFSSHIQLLA